MGKSREYNILLQVMSLVSLSSPLNPRVRMIRVTLNGLKSRYELTTVFPGIGNPVLSGLVQE